MKDIELIKFDGVNRKLNSWGKVRLLDNKITQAGYYVVTKSVELEKVVIVYARPATFEEIAGKGSDHTTFDGRFVRVTVNGETRNFTPTSSTFSLTDNVANNYIYQNVSVEFPTGTVSCLHIRNDVTVDYGMENEVLYKYFYVPELDGYVVRVALNINQILKLFGWEVAEEMAKISYQYNFHLNSLKETEMRLSKERGVTVLCNSLLYRLGINTNEDTRELARFALNHGTSMRSVLQIVKFGANKNGTLNEGEFSLCNGTTFVAKCSNEYDWRQGKGSEYTQWYWGIR
jgi:hypothetical protein